MYVAFQALDSKLPFIFGCFDGELGPGSQQEYNTVISANHAAKQAVHTNGFLQSQPGQKQSVCVDRSASVDLVDTTGFHQYTTQIHMVV